MKRECRHTYARDSFLSFLLLAFIGACSDSPSGAAGLERNSGTQADARDTCDADVCALTFPFQETTSERAKARTYRLEVAEAGLFAGEASVGSEVCLSKSKGVTSCLGKGVHAAAAWLTAGRYYVTVTSPAASEAPVEVSFGFTTSVGAGENAMHQDVARAGLQAFSVAFAKHDTEKLIYAVTDYALPSDKKREWVVDLRTSEVLWHLYVAHGENTSKKSDPNLSATFSNIEGSHQSSLGMMRSAETYTGDFGYSFRLDGLEPGYNDLVRPRDIVVHPWFGSTPKYVEQNHKAAPTFGCPAVDQGLPKSFFDALSGGVLHWYSFPDGDWSEHTTYRL
ncbi:MAG: murein L,D-transpeptidase catalytic domain family protein [Polyangiaceae bacterium]